jgi:hypothetical protein
MERNMYNEKIVDTITGEITIREYTPEEVAEVEAAIEKARLKREEAKAREDARQSALSKLIDLGLTEEEIAAL